MKKYFILVTLSLALISCGVGIKAPAPCYPVPNDNQLAWQKDEVWAFIHFGPNTFTDSEWGYGDTDPSKFNPTALDCEQWACVLKAANIKGVIMTAKHHDGFCLWPTVYTDYNISASPYKEGQGDIVKELSDACEKYGLKFGLYLSPWDRHQASYGTKEYIDYYQNQLRELLTGYGKISEIWLDGANGGDGWYGGASEKRNIDRRTYYDFPAIIQIVRELQPEAVIFSDGGPDCRWAGNERGVASETNWSFLRDGVVYPGYPNARELAIGHPDGDCWIPAECDVSIRKGWFYHPEEDSKVKTAEQLVELYYKNVGRNGKFLLNFPVDREGLIHPTDAANAEAAYKIIARQLSDDILAGAKVSGSATRGNKFGPAKVTDGDYDTYWAAPDGVISSQLVFELKDTKKVNTLLLQEYIPLGQRVRMFCIEYRDKGGWQSVPTEEVMTTIGYKRIVRFDTVVTDALRVSINDSRACPCINNIEAFYVE